MTKPAPSLDTTELILRVAASHFAEKGLAGARVDEIAAAAGVNKATLYYHIGGKAELYAAVFRENIRRAAERLASNVAKQQGAEAKFRAYITTLVENLQENRCAAPLMMREIASGGENLPPEGMQYIGKVLTVLMGILEQGQGEGVFRRTDPVLTHLMIMGSVMFHMAGEPIRQRLSALPGQDLPAFELGTDGGLAAQISEFLLHALKN